MTKTLMLAFILFCFSQNPYAQQDTTTSDKLKSERGQLVKQFNERLNANQMAIDSLTKILSNLDDKETKKRISALAELQKELDNRIHILENEPKKRVSINGKLAFTELLSIQRDIRPAELFLSSQDFYKDLSKISSITDYNSFREWKKEYDVWFDRQGRNNQMHEFLNNALSLISNATNKVPLYGPIVQTVSSGLVTLVSSFKSNSNKELVQRTPSMLSLLNVTSQFEQQKSIIDYEWSAINKDLKQLQIENNKILNDQFVYYGLDSNEYVVQYYDATLEKVRDAYKNKSLKAISNKLKTLDSDTATKGQWTGQVETYMYKVQSLRLRFGQLTTRMLSNIDRYKELITAYSDSTKFPLEFTHKVASLRTELDAVRKNFSNNFNPEKYIEDSAIMYIDQDSGNVI